MSASPKTRPIRAASKTLGEFRITAAGVAATIAAAGDDPKQLGSFEGNAYTGAPMKPEGWWHPVIVDLGGVKIPSQHRPVLRQHDHEQILGHTTSVKAEPDGIKVAGVFSGQAEHVAKVAEPARNGFRWQLSIGANPIRVEELKAGEETEVNGRTVRGPMSISRETEIGEISFVPLGADGATSAAVAASRRGKTMFWKIQLKKLAAELRAAGKLKLSDEEIDKMDEEQAKAALKKCMKADAADGDDEDEDEDEDEEEDKKKAEAKAAKRLVATMRKNAALEMERQTAITAAVKKHGIVECEVEVGGAKKKVNLVAHAIAEGWTADQAELHALRAARPSHVGVPGGLAYSTSSPNVSAPVLEAAILQAARHQFQLEDDGFYLDRAPDGTAVRRVPERLQRETQGWLKARYTDQVQSAAQKIFKEQITPQQLLAAAFSANGARFERITGEHGAREMLARWDHMEKQSLLAEGASNMSISNILANVLNKFALQGYLFVEQSWRDICAIRPVNDFKQSKSINLLATAMYRKVGATGELENASFGDQAFSNQAELYGIVGTIPYKHLVNDDLGMLTGVPLKIGQGAGLALNDNIWTLFAAMAAGTVNGDDGNTFWRTTSDQTNASKKAGKAYNANKLTGSTSALSSASLKSAKALYDNQTDPNGFPLGFDGSMPRVLFGPSNWVTALELATYRELVYGGSTASKQPQGNLWAGTFKPVMSRYIENPSYVNSTTAWWVLYDPAALSVIEVCFLNGVDTPAVLTAGPDYQFDRLGLSIRGSMPFGSNQQNFRGGVYSVGA